MNEYISQLPSMDEKVFEQSSLSSEMTDEIKNVIQVTKQYNDEFEQVQRENNDILPDYVDQLEDQLQNDGVKITDEVTLPENKNKEQVFQLHDIPEEFTVDYLVLELPNQEEQRFEGEDALEEITLPSNKEGDFTVELNLRLQEDLDANLQEFDLYNEFAEWQWSLDQTNTEDEETNRNPDSHVTASQSTHHTAAPPELMDSDTAEDDEEESNSENNDEIDSEDKDDENNESEENDTNDNDAEENDSDENDDKTNEDEDKEEDKEDDEEEDSDSNENNDENDDSSEDKDDNDDDSEVEEVEVTNNHIRHQVTKPIIDETTEELIHSVEDTIAPYQKLLSVYETYFDIQLSCESTDGDCASVPDESLKDMSGTNSLYLLYHETDEQDLLTDYIVDEIHEDIQEEVRAPFASLEEEMDSYRTFIEVADEDAEKLVESAAAAQKESRDLNKNIEETMDDIAEWREQSTELIDNQADLQGQSEEEQTAVLALEEDFQPIFTESQTLSDQATTNLESASDVYQTFDRVNEQAESIQQSGTELVEDADNLSTNLTDKLEGDEAFAENFSNVLSNSRSGNRKNEDLLSFMAKPVDTDNKGLLVKGDTFTPYFLVLISFIVALFTAYVLSTTNQRNKKAEEFASDGSLIANNTLITGITVGIGIVEGIIIGLLSAHYLGISDTGLIKWTGLMITVMLVMLLVSTYLLRQLKMIGMFILLACMSMYLFLTKALGSSAAGNEGLRAYSPLQYVEDMLMRAVQEDNGYQVTLFGILTLLIVSILANLLVVHAAPVDTTKDEEHATENQ